MTTNRNAPVLYVEDNPASRRIVRMLLKNRMKYEHVTIFHDSENFEARASRLDPIPDIVFLDIHIKPISGFEMLTVLRTLPAYANTKIVALTASVMNEEVQQLRDAGFDGCLSKPIDIDTFPDTLKQILEGDVVWQIIG